MAAEVAPSVAGVTCGTALHILVDQEAKNPEP